MSMLKRICCGRSAGSVSLVALAAWTIAIPLWAMQSNNNAPSGSSAPYSAFEVRPAEQMDAQDAAVVKAKHREIVTEAAFWGYDLNAGQWSWDQVVCPEIPNAVVLHYRKKGSKGEFL